MTAQGIDMAALEQAVSNLPGDGLAAIRQNGLARFLETGLPHTRQEDWKYTSLAPVAALSNEWLHHQAALPADAGPGSQLRQQIAQQIAAIDAHWLVVANGDVDAATLEALSSAALPGLEVWSTRQRGGAQEISTEEPMSGFNAALLRDVLHVGINADSLIGKPIGLLLADEAIGGAGVSQSRVIIEVAENARASFVESHSSVGENGQFANVVIELRLARGAQVDFVRIQERGTSHYQVGRLSAEVGRDAVLNHAAFDFGGALVRNDVSVDIIEPGAVVTLHGLYLANGQQHIDNHTRIDHRVGPAKSIEEYRGILNDRAHCVFNGKAIVHQGADGTDARQSNRNLLLSDKAEIDAKPELEIHADDVKCSHGATVGQLDRSALFYLQSRGLDRADATRLLTRAFAASAVQHIPVTAARAHIEAAIDSKVAALVDGASR